MIVLDENAVDRILKYVPLVDYLQECHQGPTPMIEDLVLANDDKTGTTNVFRSRIAWENNKWLGIKCVTEFPNNRKQQNLAPAVQGQFILFDGSNGTPKIIIDSASLTRWKTACDSALASRYLSKQDAESLLVVGAGNIAETLVKAHLAVRPTIRRLNFWNRSIKKAETLATKFESLKLECAVFENLPDAVPQAEIIVTATRAISPVIKGNWLSPGTHLDLVGASTKTMREVDDETVKKSHIFVDCRKTTIEKVGDLALPIKSGAITKGCIRADLFQLCQKSHPGRINPTEITLFKNGGGGHLDLMTAKHIYDRIQKV